MKNRILSMLLCFCMTLSLLPISALAAEPAVTIGGVIVDSNDWYATTDTSGTVTSEGADPDNWNIHVAMGGTTATVTLKEATIANPTPTHAINASDCDLNIVLEGTENQIGTETDSSTSYAICNGGNVDISGDGNLTLKGYYGISANGGAVDINIAGDLNISSAWQLFFTSGNLAVSAKNIAANGFCIQTGDVSLTATDGDISVTSSNGSSGVIRSGGNVSITAPKGVVSLSGANNAAYCSGDNSSVNISAKNDVTLGGSVYCKAATVTSESGNIAINGYYQGIYGIAATNAVAVSAPQGNVTLTSGDTSNIISGSFGFTLDITSGGELNAKGGYGIAGFSSAVMKADTVNLSLTSVGYGFNGGMLSITNPDGGNCSGVSISGGGAKWDTIFASSDVTIKANQVLIAATDDAPYAINATGNDSTITIGDAGMIVGAVSIKGTNVIAPGVVSADKNGGDASRGLNLVTNTPTESTYYKAGNGYALWKDVTDNGNGNYTGTLVLHNATINNEKEPVNHTVGSDHEGIALPEGNVTIQVEGTNEIKSTYGNGIGYCDTNLILSGNGTLTPKGKDFGISLGTTETGGSLSFASGANVILNGVVYIMRNGQGNTTIYGNLSIPDDGNDSTLNGNVTIATGARLTVPQGRILWFGGTVVNNGLILNNGKIEVFNSLTNNGEAVNNGVLVLPPNFTVDNIKSLNITGDGMVYLFEDGCSAYNRIYVKGNIYANGGVVNNDMNLSDVTPTQATYYEAGNGYFIFTPASGETSAKITLHNANIPGTVVLPSTPMVLSLEGANKIPNIDAYNAITVTGNGTLDADLFCNSGVSCVMTVNSGAKLNTMYRTELEGVITNTIYGSYKLSEDARLSIESTHKLALAAGAVFTLENQGNLIFNQGATLGDMPIGAGASIVNHTYITLPQGTTAAQIQALPLSGSGVIRVVTAYDNHGYPETWDIYTNDGILVREFSGFDLTTGDHSGATLQSDGYTWTESGVGEARVGTLTLGNHTYIQGDIMLPDENIIINSGTNTIINGTIGARTGNPCQITFTGTGSLTMNGINGSAADGDEVTVSGGADITIRGSVFIGASGGANGTLNVSGRGTSLTASAAYGYAIECDTINVNNGASLTVSAQGDGSRGIQALTGVNVTGGSTLTAGCDYGVYIIDGELTVDANSRLITNGAVAPFCIVDKSSNKQQGDVLELPGIPSGTKITSVRGDEEGYRYTYWSLVPTSGSLGVTNENHEPATLTGAAVGKLTFMKAESNKNNSGDNNSSPIISYTLSFETNGGSKFSSITKNSGTNVVLSGYVPTHEGYDFAGWYSDETLIKKVTSITLTKNTTVYAKWIENAAQTKDSFTDVSDSDYFYDAVLWASEKDVTSGTTSTSFGPSMICTRGQMVAFLWRAMGSPEPTDKNCPFTDVSKDAFYYKAVLWAVENGITAGATATTFSPNATVTRGQTVTFLWRAAGKPTATATNPYSDVAKGDYEYEAVLWAMEKGITQGTSSATFSPSKPCTRAQIVTFLYRYFGK